MNILAVISDGDVSSENVGLMQHGGCGRMKRTHGTLNSIHGEYILGAWFPSVLNAVWGQRTGKCICITHAGIISCSCSGATRFEPSMQDTTPVSITAPLFFLNFSMHVKTHEPRLTSIQEKCSGCPPSHGTQTSQKSLFVCCNADCVESHLLI